MLLILPSNVDWVVLINFLTAGRGASQEQNEENYLKNCISHSIIFSNVLRDQKMLIDKKCLT